MSLASEIKKRVVDEKADTLNELCVATGYSRAWMSAYAIEQVKLGKWERVFKTVSGRTSPAYRRKAK